MNSGGRVRSRRANETRYT